MQEDTGLQEAQFEPGQPEIAEEETDRKRSFNVELVIVACIGILLGFLVKTEASKRITMGFDDYKVMQKKQSYDIWALEQELKNKAAEESAAVQEAQPQAEVEEGSGVESDCAGDTCAIN